MSSTVEDTIFKTRSTIFYPSAKLFPATIQQDVTQLYGFVRTVDDYVDVQPQQLAQFKAVRRLWQNASSEPNFDTTHFDSDDLHTRLTKNIVRLSAVYGFERHWVASFFDAMQMDVDQQTYRTLEDTMNYVYGSAEVIGLMMAKIMGVPDEALPYAQLQGRAMQWINFIRDLSEDLALGRCYFPREDLKQFGLVDLRKGTILSHPRSFEAFIRYELERYYDWQSQAEHGFHFIPDTLVVALIASVKQYNLIVKDIKSSPLRLVKFDNTEINSIKLVSES